MEQTRRTYRNTLSKIFAPSYTKNSASPQSDEFTSCADLPFSRFIKVTTTGDLSHLGRCKDPEALWERIYSEYTEISGDTTNNQGLILAKQITVLTNRIKITNAIVQYLSYRGAIPDLVKELQNMGYRLTYTDLAADLERTLSLSKSDHVKLTAARHAYEKLEKQDKTSELDWYKMLSSLAKHRQVVSINPALITVIEYCAMQKEFSEYCDMMSQAAKR